MARILDALAHLGDGRLGIGFVAVTSRSGPDVGRVTVVDM